MLPSRPMSPIHTRSGLASLMRAAMGPKSRLPNSHSRNSTSCRPRFLATSRPPSDMKWTEGNLLVTMAMVLGGLGEAASASNRVLGTVSCGLGPSDQAGNCMSYLASDGMPKVWCTSTLLYRWATPMADRMAPVAYGPINRSTLSEVTSYSSVSYTHLRAHD